MPLCSLPDYWPAVRTMFTFSLFVLGYLSIAFYSCLLTLNKMKISHLIPRNPLWRLWFRWHKHQEIKALTISSAILSPVYTVLQLRTKDTCYLSPSLVNWEACAAVLLAVYLACCWVRTQGLSCYLSKTLKLSWDYGDIISFHLAGPPPHAITRKYSLSMITAIHEQAKRLEAARLPRTLRLESWLFVRNADPSDPAVTRLRNLLTCKLIICWSKKVSKFENKIAKFILGNVLKLMHLFVLLIKWYWFRDTLNRLTAPNFRNMIPTMNGHYASKEMTLAIEELQNLDPRRMFKNLGVRQLTGFEIVGLIVSHPHIAPGFVPWTTGFEFSTQ